jgi:hypothetical protein
VSKDLAAGFSVELRAALEPLLAEVASLNQRIEQIATQVHPEVALLKQIKGVGTLSADGGRSGIPLASGVSLHSWWRRYDS